MTKKLLLLLVGFCLFCISSYAQLLDSTKLAEAKVFYSLQEALKNPDEVYKLNLSKKGLKEIPTDIGKLTKLQVLNIRKNKIKSLPEEIGNLKNLQEIDMASNHITLIPSSIGNLTNLIIFRAGKNNISQLPPEFGKLEKLELLDLWDNEISEFPKEISSLTKLKTVDLQAIMLNAEQQQAMADLIPNAKIKFSTSCNCR